jgi:hypothetical protein
MRNRHVADVFDDHGNRPIAGPGTRIGGLEVLDGHCNDRTVVARSACRLVVIFGPALRATLTDDRRERIERYAAALPPTTRKASKRATRRSRERSR